MKKYKYWQSDNKDYCIPPSLLPSWVAVVQGIEAFRAAYEELNLGAGDNEQAKEDTMADPCDEGSE
jgi:hypothetical protein